MTDILIPCVLENGFNTCYRVVPILRPHRCLKSWVLTLEKSS